MMPKAGESAPVNVLAILVDDLDEATFNLLLERQQLPNIQSRLLDRGTRFTNSFVNNSACCPSRATFLSGQNAHNHGVQTVWGSNGGYQAFHQCQGGTCAALDRPTVATHLAAGTPGYYNGYIGKYMNGYARFPDQIPAGWHYWAALQTPGNGLDLRPNFTAGFQVTYTIYTNQPDGVVRPQNPPVYQTKHLGDQAVAFLRRWDAEQQQRFFLVISPAAPHVFAPPTGNDYVPGQRHPQFVLRAMADRPGWNGYCDQTDERPCPAGSLRMMNDPDRATPKPGYDLPSLSKPSFNQADCADTTGDKPPWICVNWANLDEHGNLDNLRRQHLDRLETMLSVDTLVGQAITELESLGVLDNTLIIFTSDNGFYLGEFMLGNKQHPHEESIRVPLVIRQPQATAGARSAGHLVVNTDLAPTIMDYAGLAWNDPQFQIDGRSLRPLLDGVLDAPWRRRFLVSHHFPRDVTWPSGQDWLWRIPDYAGVRTEATTGSLGAGHLYVEHFQPFALESGNVQYVEHYHLPADLNQRLNVRRDARYDRTRRHLSGILNRLRQARAAEYRQLEEEAAPPAVIDNRCPLVDDVTIRTLYDAGGQWVGLRQHVYAGGNAWYRDSQGTSLIWGPWRMLSNGESWGHEPGHPPVADLEAAEVRDWYDAAGNPTSTRQLFYRKNAGPNGEDVWFRDFANPQIPWYITPWMAFNLDPATTPWLAAGKFADAAAIRPLFNDDGSRRNLRQFFYCNAAPSGTFFYRDSTNPDGSPDPLGVNWPTQWQSGSYRDWANHANRPPLDRLDAVVIPVISADRRVRQLFYSGPTVWWRDSGPNGRNFPSRWQSATLEEHFKMGQPPQPVYPRPPISCALPPEGAAAPLNPIQPGR